MCTDYSLQEGCGYDSLGLLEKVNTNNVIWRLAVKKKRQKERAPSLLPNTRQWKTLNYPKRKQLHVMLPFKSTMIFLVSLRPIMPKIVVIKSRQLLLKIFLYVWIFHKQSYFWELEGYAVVVVHMSARTQLLRMLQPFQILRSSPREQIQYSWRGKLVLQYTLGRKEKAVKEAKDGGGPKKTQDRQRQNQRI